MKVVAVYNIKGGVGKTAAAVNLSCYAAAGGGRTLVWDLDPQGAATFYLGVKAKVKGGVKSLVARKHPLAEFIKSTDYARLDIVPADFSYRNMDLRLDEKKKPLQRLRKLLKPLADDYDYVILDCPPSISLVSENVFQAADVLLVPTIPTTLSLRTLLQLLEFIRQNDMADLPVLPFFSMVDRRRQLHRLVVEHPPGNIPRPLETFIPYASEVEKMGINEAPIVAYAPHGKAARAYETLWEELRLTLSGLYH